MKVVSNPALASLIGLENIDYSTIDSLIILDCPNLSYCEVKSVCDFLENVGAAYVSENAPGCENVPEVEANCQNVSVDEPVKEDKFLSIFPNPTSGIIHIDETLKDHWDITLRHVSGGFILSQKLTSDRLLDLSGLPNGIYLLELRSKDRLVISRVVKE